jgi:hypothetical protein
VLRPAIEVVIGRTYAKAGGVEWELKDKQDRGEHLEMTGTLKNTTHAKKSTSPGSIPKNWNGRVVIWLDDRGTVRPPSDDVKKLVAAGNAVVGADLLFQGGSVKRLASSKTHANSPATPTATITPSSPSACTTCSRS